MECFIKQLIPICIVNRGIGGTVRYVIRVMAFYDNTVISGRINSTTYTINKGNYKQFDVSADEVRSVTCDKYCFVVEYNKGTGSIKVLL